MAGIWAVPAQVVAAVGTRREEEEQGPCWPWCARCHIPGRAGCAENPGTVLLLKPPIQGRDSSTRGRKRREQGALRASVCGRTDAGAAVDSPDAPRCPFCWGCTRSPPESVPSLAVTLIYSSCHTLHCYLFYFFFLIPVGLCGFSEVSPRVGLSLVALTCLLSAEDLQEMF